MKLRRTNNSIILHVQKY